MRTSNKFNIPNCGNIFPPKSNDTSTINVSSNLKTSYTSTITNVITNNYISDNTKPPVFIGREKIKESVDYSKKQADFSSSESSLFIRGADFIYIPNKAITLLKKRVTNRELKKVHEDRNTAIDLIMIFLSFLSDTYFRELEYGKITKQLSAKHLQKTFQRVTNYKSIIHLLGKPFNSGPLIECDNKYIPGLKCFGFKLGDNYRAKGLERYYFMSDLGKQVYQKYLDDIYFENEKNIIVKNLLAIYPKLELPTVEGIKEKAKILIKLGYSKKGKNLSFENNNRARDIRNGLNKTYVEDAIFRFEYLTAGGLRVPRAGGENSGGRVCDSFTLMDRWIRDMISIDGENLVECDYTCLHPNIAISIYGGKQLYLTHEFIASELNEDVSKIKTEHLSFFNKAISGQQSENGDGGSMSHSILFDYYSKNESQMMENLMNDKNANGYKITTQKLFSKEVEIMTSVIKLLNRQGIYVLYVYDALYCLERDKKRVVKLMNQEVLKYGVFTQVKTK